MRDPLDPIVWLAVFAAVSAATLVADICVGAAVTIAEGRLEPQQRLDMLLTNWTVALSNTCLALAIAAVVAARPEGGLLLVPPTVLLMAAYRAYLSERRRNAELEFLYEATRTLSRSSEIVPELEALLARTAATFRVGAVDLVLFSAEPNRSARSSLNRDGERRMLEPIDEPLAESLRALAAGPHRPGRDRPHPRLRAARVLPLRAAWRTACVAPLHGEAGCVGLFAIAGRESVDRNFTDEDLRLLETLTGNVTVALQYDRLEQAVRQLESLQHELERKALYDSLTQLANRSLFHNRLEHALQSRRPGVCVLLLDIDEFKAINDSHGHHAGDELLRAVADRLRGCLREGDTAARLGGDEFALLLDRAGGEDDAIAVAKRLLGDFEAPHRRGRRARARAREHRHRGRRARQRRPRRAAAQGRRRAVRGEAPRQEPVPDLPPVDARRAPQAPDARVRARARGVRRGADASSTSRSCRSHDCRAGGARGAGALEPPGARARAARRLHRLRGGDRRGRRDRRHRARARGREGGELRIPIHANVCAPELIDPGFLDRLDALVERHQVPPELLVFELTERAFVGDDPVPIAVLEALHARGMGVAVDDFGTGYSSLAYLSRLPVDTMKIPKQFIDEVTGSREHHALARAVIELGAALDLKVVAEGIETPDQIDALRAFGCELGQGFYYGLPTDADLALRRVELLRQDADRTMLRAV